MTKCERCDKGSATTDCECEEWMNAPMGKPKKPMAYTKVKVNLYFVSGEKVLYNFDMNDWVKLMKNLSSNWDDVTITGDVFGCDFSHVTHYIVQKQDE